MMRANVERKYDQYEDLSMFAMMQRKATNAKRIKQSDLFKRPVDEGKEEEKVINMKEKVNHANEWLGQFEQFSGKLSS